MPDDPLLFQLQQVVQNSVFHCMCQILLLVQTVQKSKVNVIRFQGLKLPVNRAPDGIQICCPSIFSSPVICAEVHLEIYLVPASGHGTAKYRKGLRIRGSQVKIVYPVFQSHGRGGFYFLLPGCSDGAGAEAEYADLLFPMGQFSVFHRKFLLIQIPSIFTAFIIRERFCAVQCLEVIPSHAF